MKSSSSNHHSLLQYAAPEILTLHDNNNNFALQWVKNLFSLSR
jgi:hypothetical protein